MPVLPKISYSHSFFSHIQLFNKFPISQLSKPHHHDEPTSHEPTSHMGFRLQIQHVVHQMVLPRENLRIPPQVLLLS